ncbi:MAG: hypothetical protein O2992_13030, partial [Gemmatimonadetes bacterium]|nr:hypothetical protein [Gemmatimonadota bacterium]
MAGSARRANLDLHQPRPHIVYVVTAHTRSLHQLDLADVAAHTLFEIDDALFDGACGALLLTHAAVATLFNPLNAVQ